MLYLVLKRVLDLGISFFGLLISFPILLLCILILFLELKSFPFFIQNRPGLNEKIFSIFKLKTMSDKTDDFGNLLPDVDRLHGFGKLVRKLSIDEIPQLFNVLIGDMSLVGPRPLLVEYLPIYSETQKLRHKVKPGITGWAQINGRNAISWQKKFELDIWYVQNCSFILDIRILFYTFNKIFKSKDVNQSLEHTMVKFNGTN